MATPRKQKKASDLSRTRDLPEQGLQTTRGIFEKLGRLEQKQAQGWVHIERKKEHETLPEERGVNVELEAFAGDLYRLIIGNRQPKLRATNEGGILSKEISEFKQIGKLGRVMSTDEAVRSGIAAAFVVSYFLQETDLHGLNIGVNKNNEIVRIDFDHSLQFESDKQFPVERIMKVPDHKALAAAPGWANWEKTLEGLHSNELFIKDKIKYCLKIILLDNSNFKAIAQDHVSRANEERLLHVQKRREELEKFLKSNHEFKTYLSRYHASYWEEIKTEISEHNLEIQKDIDKLKRYIELVKKTDPAHFVIPQELSKEKYQGFLSRDALLEKLNIELKSYEEHLLNIDAIHTHFQALANFSPLHEAAERGQIERVSELLKDPTVRSDALTVDGSTALYVAAEHGHADVVKMLLSERKIDVSQIDKALMRSVMNDDAVVFKELVGSSSPEGVNEALSEAVINRGNVEIVKAIFESNPEFNASSLLDFVEEGEQKSLFYIAAAKGHASLVSELLNDNNAENELGDAFNIAVEKGHANVVSKLISKMGNVDDYLKLAIQKPEINGEIVGILLSGQLSHKTINKVFLQLVSREDENMLKVFIDSKHPGLNIENARQEAGKLGKTKSLEILNAPTDAPVITTTFHL